MAKGFRADRLAEEIRRIISSMLLTEVKDPRLTGRMVSITDVEVTSDGSYATCYISVLATSGDDMEGDSDSINQDVLDGLKSASGILRSEIGKKIKIRRVPELIFKLDHSLAYGRHIEEVIKELGKDDE